MKYKKGMLPISDDLFDLTKEGIAQYIKDYDLVSFAEIRKRFKNTDGGWQIRFKTNIIFWDNMSQEFINIIDSLLKEGIIYFKPTGVITYFIDGVLLRLPVVKKNINYKTEHWLPVVLRGVEKLSIEEPKLKKIIEDNITMYKQLK